MDTPDNNKRKWTRRKSDLTLLGTSTQDMEDRVYTLQFGVNLLQTSFEGLNNYSVAITCTNKISKESQTLTSVLEFRSLENNNTISIDGGPPYPFSITDKTLDLSCTDLDEEIVKAVIMGISWLKGEIKDDWISTNRRRVPTELLNDGIAVNLLMSSISTIIGGSIECHNKLIKERKQLFTSKTDYTNAMYETLKDELEEFTRIAINRGVQHYMANS